MKVRVDPGSCAGFGTCLGLCPQVFQLHEDGYAVALVSEVPKEHEDAVREAGRQCPANAIFVTEDPQ